MSLRLSSPALLVLSALATLVPSGSAAAQAGRNPLFHPNHEKYSDAGAKPATGRSGSASLESRALLARDGTALVEATTGSLEAGTSPGQIRKLQVKGFTATDAQLFVQNYNGLNGNGYWSASYRGLGRKQKLQLQANIGGIDPNRTDVVTVTTLVVRRPDVAVDAVTAPARALAGTRVNVVATVAEKNGDVGARTTCVLTVDGQMKDQARGIWVDAGHTVSCAFQTSLAALGVHEVGVYATGMLPADWDMSNNSASTSIEILPPETPLNYSARFDATDYDYQNDDRYRSSDGGYVYEKKENGTRQSRSLTMSSWTTADAFQFPVNVRTALTTAGSKVYDQTNQIPFQPQASWSGADCGNLFRSGFSISVCNYHLGTVQRSQVDVSSYGGYVTYFGDVYYDNYGWDGYAYNYGDTYTTSFGAYPVGGDVNAVLELADARGMLFAARPVVSLTTSPIHDPWDYCIPNIWGDVTYCSTGYREGARKNGLASDASR